MSWLDDMLSAFGTGDMSSAVSNSIGDAASTVAPAAYSGLSDWSSSIPDMFSLGSSGVDPNSQAFNTTLGDTTSDAASSSGLLDTLKSTFPGLKNKDGSLNIGALAKVAAAIMSASGPSPYQAAQSALKYGQTQNSGLSPQAPQFKGLNTPLPGSLFQPTKYARGGGALRAAGAASAGQAGPVVGSSPGQADDEPAMLSHGEFVIPADVVSHLGDGNNNAGALKLHALMRGAEA
jgi:hypothetical protein